LVLDQDGPSVGGFHDTAEFTALRCETEDRAAGQRPDATPDLRLHVRAVEVEIADLVAACADVDVRLVHSVGTARHGFIAAVGARTIGVSAVFEPEQRYLAETLSSGGSEVTLSREL